MSKISKSRLLATSAVAGLSILHLSGPAHAQDSFGIHNDQPDPLTITVGEDEEIEGNDIGIYADNGPVIVDNAGSIRGNGTGPGGLDSRPSGGIVIAQPGSSVTNSGDISGAGNGIATSYFFSEDEDDNELPPQPLAADTTVVNTGSIIGEAGAGVSLTGGGSVTNNDGLIRGANGFPGSGVNGIGVAISEFPDAIAEGVTGVGTITNIDTGLIEGQTFGVILQGGGTINNEGGTIRSFGQFNPAIPGAQAPIGIVMGATAEQEGRSATLNNEGVVLGLIGVLAGGALETTTVNNDGIIIGQAAAIIGQSNGELVVNNEDGGEIGSGGNGIQAGTSQLTVDNAGLIRGDGQNGINILTAGAVITNSGTIRGGQAGIITNTQTATPTTPAQFVAFNTTVNNSGSITGTNNDGIRLAGGGTVTNSGTITGVSSANNAAGTDGVSIFNQVEQADYVASVTNSETGVITGASRGVIVSGGGTIDNAGSITGGTIGVILQSGSFTEEGEPIAGVSGSITNSGSITGNGPAGLIVGSGLETSEVVNSGSIASLAGDGVLVTTMAGGVTTIENGADGEIVGASSGIELDVGALALDNAGTIRGNGRNGSVTNPDGGVVLSGESSTIVNSGDISGAQFGIVTHPVLDPATGQLVGTVVDTTVTNSGTITGENDDGIRLAGGGTITNSGTIRGLATNANGTTDGVSIFAHNDQDLEGYSGVLANEEGGLISGIRTGAALSGGGEITNAGTITGGQSGAFIQGNAIDGVERDGQFATVVNSGTISGTGDFGGTLQGGHGLGIGSNLEAATVTNSGTISSAFAEGIQQASRADLVVTNEAGGTIEGGTSGIYAGATGTIAVVNAGTIRGNGVYDGFDAAPDAGITIGTAGSSVDNSGTISGAGAGITTASQFDEETGQLVGLAVDTQILNSGTIIGETNDAVRLIGGGTVANSGTIRAEAGDFSDGISMYAFTDQAKEDFGASVVNAETGEISGTRFGIILSGGGSVENAGDIAGVNGGIFIQGTAINTDPGEDRSGLTASVVNSGTISGSRADGLNGYGVGFGSDLSSATLDNSGTITSDAAAGVFHGTLGDVTITNAEGGTIEGVYGVFAGGEGSLTLDNAGTIHGTGTYEGVEAPANAGVMVQSGGAAITNSGTISGAGYGIVTQLFFNDETGQTEIRAVGTEVTNSGTIRGDANDAVRLFGGGSVVNSGTIEGVAGELTDGITIQAFGGQDTSDSTMLGSVVNEAGGTISGARYGVLAVSGASVENAGTITGGLTGVVIGRQNSAGKEGVLVNSGTINGGVLIDVDSATATNSGSIVSETGIGLSSLGQIALVNSGTLAGGSGIAAQLSAFDDSVTLKTGSAISGLVDAGDGVDSLILDGDVLELTEAQQLTGASGFETLEVAAGYWSTDGFVGEFGSVAINEGGALQVNEVSFESEGETFFSTPIFTPSIVNNGLLVANFSENDAVSGLGQLSVTGTGAVQLLGEAVFTLDTDSFAHTGGTIVSNGGLVLTGTLLGDVTTEGDGFFQLGAGGTEGNFAGNIVNDGTFVFNRSDDYDFLGAFSGSGTLTKMGDSILSFLGDYQFSGTTNILAGSVRIAGAIDPETEFNVGSGSLDLSGNDQTIGGLAGGEESTVVIGDTTLTVNQQGNTQFGGDITGEGSLVKTGTGTLNLTGNNSYTGPTTVDGGKLAVNGSIVSPVTVNPDGTLGGNGQVGDTTVDGGTLAPGNSIGRLTVNGDLNLAAGSTYEVEVNAAGQADRVDATGIVTIASTAAVEVLAEDGNYNPRTDYVILTGAGGVTGTFGSVTTDLAFLDPLLRYGANSVTLSLYRNDIDFADVAANANQAGVAAAVQSLGIDNLFFETVLTQNAATAQATFGDLSGEILASTVSGLNDDSRNLRGALLGLKAPEEGGAFVWGSAFGSWGDFDAGRASYAMDADNKGFVTGVGFGGNGFAAALSAGIGGSDFKLGGRADKADVESKYLAAHATYGKGEGLRAAFGVSYAWHDIDTTRGITVAPLAQTLTSKRDADTFQVFGELGYDLVSGKMLLTPFIRLAHVSTDADAVTEAGGNAALVVGKTEAKTTFLSLGGRIQLNASEPGFQPYASLAWNRAFDDRAGAFGARLAAGGPAFTIVGTEIPKNSAEVEAGFEYSTGNFRIGAAYSGTLASDRNSHGARITARIAF